MDTLNSESLLALYALGGMSAKVATDLVRIALTKSGKSTWNDVVLPLCAFITAIAATFLAGLAYFEPDTIWSTQLIAKLVIQGFGSGASAIGITELTKVGRPLDNTITVITEHQTLDVRDTTQNT